MDKPGEVEFTWLLFTGVIIMLLLALAVIVFVIVHQRRVDALRFTLQQQELEYQTKMLRAVITSQESERERIAHDLHDEIGASLSAARLYINQIKYEAKDSSLQNLAREASQIVGDTLKSVRQIVQNMSPIVLEKLGFCRALAQLSSRLEAAGIPVDTQVDAAADELAVEVQLGLYRIIQELFGNSMKHAQATSLTLHLQQSTSGWLLLISDNGCGFAIEQVIGNASTGMGLAGIAARAKLLDGQLQIESSPDNGTHVTLRLPN